MKKLITLLALCCLMVTGAWAGVTSVKVSPQNVGGVETYYVYTLQGKNQTTKYWAAPNGELNAMATTPTKWFFKDAGNGYYYIADYATGKYLCYTEVGRDMPVTLDATTTPSTWQIKLNGSYVTFCPSSNDGFGLNCNDGHRMYDAGTGNGNTWWTMEESTETPGSGKTYTVNITGATGATVTFGSNTYANGQTFSAENPTASQFTASEVPGFYPSISIGTNTINVTYNLLPFTTGRTYNLTLKGNIVYYDEATGNIKAGNVEDSENTSFIIGGTYADGYTLKSVGANAYLKHENVNNDNAKATTTANESEATRYEYAVKDGYHYFKIRGTANNYVNYRDGYFSSWNNGSAFGNDGSRLTFSEPVDPDKGYHIFQNNGTLNTTGTSAYCSQWTSSHINPQISINVTDGNGAANDMEKNSTYANNGIVCYTGNNRDSQGYKATLTVAASYGYKITGFEFDASKADNSDYTIDVTAGGTTKTVSGTTVQHFSQTGVNAQEFVIVIKETATSATHNKPILLNNFYVTYEAAEPLESEYKLVFDNAHSNVPYRIPAVGQAYNGDLIFVTDYRYSHADIGQVTNGKLDLKYRKKYADGHWGDEKTLQACIDNGSEFIAFGDPCIVCDRESNRVMVTSCCGNIGFTNGTYENHQGWARWYSSDGGETWDATFVDLAPQVVEQLDERQGDKMNAFFIGSGKISQSHIIKKGQYYRLYCASNTRMQSGKCNFVWYSDDFGATWNLLGSPDVKAINGGDEPKADELPDGSVVISSRDSGRIFNIFHYTDYENAEGYWGSQATSSSNNSGCYGASCNGEILIVPVVKKSNNTKTYLALQSIPAAGSRRDVSIYWKELTDFTKYRNASELAPNWTKFQVSGTTSAYSTMCQLQDGDIAFFYEENEYNGGYDMVYKKFSVEAITDEAYEYYNLNATEKAAYLTSCVGTYFDEESEEIQELAETYEATPTMKNYDALNAAFLSPDDLFFTPGLYQIQIGSGTGADHENYTNYYLYAKGKSEGWPIGLTTDATDETTYVYIWGSHDNWHMEFNHGTADSYYAANNCKAATSAASLTFTPNADKTEWKIWGGNQRWMGWKSNGVVFVGSSSTSSTENDNCYFKFTKVEEELPTPALSLETESTVTSSQLSELSITFTGDNAAQVQLSATQHTAYLTPKTSTPAQVKAQNGKLKAAGETPAAIEGNITKDTNTDGKFNIAFEDEIPAGDYELSIPEGTFLVGTTPVPELTANYTVEEPAPALPPYADLPLTSGVYEIQNSPAKENRGYLVDYTSHTGGPSLAECQLSGHVDKHPSDRNDGTTTSSKWYIHNDNGTYYIVSLSTLGNNTEPLFLAPATANNTVSTYSTDKVALTIAQHQSYTVTGSDGNTYHCYLISNSASTNVYLSAACGTASTSGAVKTDTNGNDGGAPWVFIPCDESTLTTEQVALRDKAIEIINYEIPTAGKVYTIKAHFTNESYTDLYLTSSTSAEQLLVPMPSTATANQSYWVAEASGNTDRPWKFKSGYGYAKYLDWQNGGLSANGDNFGVLDCGTVSGTYHLNVSTNDRNIGTWGNNNDTKKGFGAVGSGGCWSQNKGHSNATATNYWTTDYEIVEVTGVKAYLVSCDNTDGGVAPAFANYAGVANVKNGGYIIVPNGTTLDATNFPAAEISGYTGSVTFNGTTITVTYEASATPDGFHIYENNGAYSNTVSSSSYKDKWLSTDTNPQFTILVTNVSGNEAANNMYHNETYKDSGILCFTGNDHINYKSTMTVSVQNGYKITGYTFKVKNLEGTTSDHGKVVTTAGQTINTTAANQTVVVSGLEDVTSFTITLDGSTGSYNEGIVFTDFYVTYEGEPVVEVPATGIYYIYDNNKSGYLYNNSITSEGTSELTETLTGTKVTDDNRYLWRVVSDGSSTSITLTNGQGTGYKVSDADETHTVDLESVNWKFEELPMITIRPQGKPAYDEYPVHYVSVKYKSKTEAIEKVLDEGYAKYTDGNTQYAHDGGFLVSRDDWTASKYGYGDASSRICEEDGLPFTKCRIYTNADTENTNHWWYYTQQDEDLISEIQEKISNFPFETDMLGLVEESSIPWDNENLMAVVYAAMADWFEAYEYKEMLGRFNRLVAAVEVVKPTIGNGYKLYVKDKDGNKYYLANDKVTANADEAEVYVVGGTDDESCNYLFASNNNGASNYLPNMSSAGSTYEEDACAYKIQGMGQITGENVEEEAAFLYGSFLLTNAEGNILNAITGSSASLNPRTEPYVVYGESSTETSAIWMEEVEYPYNKPQFAVGSPDDHNGGYASIWLPFPMVFPEGVEAYRATSVENDGILILTKVNEDTNTVAAGGYILRTPEQKTDTDPEDVDNLPLVLPAPADPEDVTPYADNAFVGSTENPLVVKEEGSWATFKAKYEGTPYVLARKNGVIGYYKYRETETCLPKGKAIWFSNYNADSSAECLRFTFEEVISAIEALHGNTDNAEIYDLQGHRLNKVEKGQVNVINGKKVMFK